MVAIRQNGAGEQADKKISIFGSTGSIGTQTLKVVDSLGNVEVVALVCHDNIDLLAQQIRKYHPRYAAITTKDGTSERLKELKFRVRDTGTQVLAGTEEAISACADKDVDIVVNSTVGVSGLVPTVGFIERGKNVALANKETIVTGGSMVMKLAEEHNVRILPVDSEHSAIFQCLQGSNGGEVEKLILTASGGPFREFTPEMLRGVTVEQALNHPTWKMGHRITIDSATLMNKGFEIIEARWLFGVLPENIEVVIHPQSKMHSAVQFVDGAIIAQIGTADMCVPIQYALTYPNRYRNSFPKPELAGTNLEFMSPDPERFRCLKLAQEALKIGGNATAVLNGADEEAVGLFLDRKIPFLDIPKLIESALEAHMVVKNPTLGEILGADRWAREFVRSRVQNSRSRTAA